MSKSKNTLRIWNVNILGGHLVEAIVLVGFGAFFIGVWLLGKLAEKGQWEKMFVPFMGFAAFAAGLGIAPTLAERGSVSCWSFDPQPVTPPDGATASVRRRPRARSDPGLVANRGRVL